MFSKIFSSARSIFTPATVPATERTLRRKSSRTEMVTTRGQKGKAAAAEDAQSSIGDLTVVQTPASSSRKRQRSARKGDTTPAIKESEPSPTKKRKLPVRSKGDDEPVETHTHIAVEIPVTSITPGSVRKTAASAHVIENTVEHADHTTPEKTVVEIKDSDEEEEEEPAVLVSSKKTTPSRATSSVKKTPQRKEQVKDMSDGSATKSGTPKPKHKKFGSEEPEDESAKILEPAANQEAQSEDDGSDDEAPEEVVTQDAAETVRKNLKEAAKVAEEQISAARTKRKERDALLKEQAKNTVKKRKRDNVAESEHDKEEVSADEDIESSEEAADDGEDDAMILAGSEFASVPLKTTFTRGDELPDFLPAEYLAENDASESEDEVEHEQLVQRSKRTKFTDLGEKKPKDLRKGSTTFRVAKSNNPLLAPKASNQARLTKEAWLQGRPGKNGVTNRRPFSSGFFVAKK
ncbi:hypothetical protein PVAG01_09467 [Phlyctema vagabunda]|uniref:Uncharacterized protein n=1 Tax=Phlyctema vagabunda TaxID=108571 RepID=A0ABR4P7G4_9HELO